MLTVINPIFWVFNYSIKVQDFLSPFGHFHNFQPPLYSNNASVHTSNMLAWFLPLPVCGKDVNHSQPFRVEVQSSLSKQRHWKHDWSLKFWGNFRRQVMQITQTVIKPKHPRCSVNTTALDAVNKENVHPFISTHFLPRGEPYTCRANLFSPPLL